MLQGLTIMYATRVLKPTVRPNTRAFIISAFATPAPLVDRIADVAPKFSFSFEPYYRVILVYSNWTNDKPIGKLVSASIPIITEKHATNVVRRTRIEGRAIIVTVLKNEALTYMQNIKNKGLDCVIDEA